MFNPRNTSMLFLFLFLIYNFQGISIVAYRYHECLQKTGLCRKKPEGWNKRCEIVNGKEVCHVLTGGLSTECDEDKISQQTKEKCKEYSTNYEMKLSELTPRVCTCYRLYKPVCAVDENGISETFNNDCLAKCYGYEVVAEGQCKDVEEELSDISLVSYRYNQCLGKFSNKCKEKPEGWNKRCEIVNGKEVCHVLTGGLSTECDEDKISQDIKDKCKEYSTNYQMELSDSDISLVALRYFQCLNKKTGLCVKKPDGWNMRCKIENGKKICHHLIGGLGIDCDESLILDEIKEECKDYSTNFQKELSDNSCLCTMEYAPVCGIDINGNEHTFGNKCSLNCQKNFSFLHKNEC